MRQRESLVKYYLPDTVDYKDTQKPSSSDRPLMDVRNMTLVLWVQRRKDRDFVNKMSDFNTGNRCSFPVGSRQSALVSLNHDHAPGSLTLTRSFWFAGSQIRNQFSFCTSEQSNSFSDGGAKLEKCQQDLPWPFFFLNLWCFLQGPKVQCLGQWAWAITQSICSRKHQLFQPCLPFQS